MLLGKVDGAHERADDLVALPVGEDERLAGEAAFGVDQDVVKEAAGPDGARGAEVFAAFSAYRQPGMVEPLEGGGVTLRGQHR